MQLSATFPALSDNAKKQVRKQIKLQSATALQKGGPISNQPRRHTGNMAGNRARARTRAKG